MAGSLRMPGAFSGSAHYTELLRRLAKTSSVYASGRGKYPAWPQCEIIFFPAGVKVLDIFGIRHVVCCSEPVRFGVWAGFVKACGVEERPALILFY